ncbi:MAG: LacI family DNA-binding transcriptional regulator [Chthoniobacteraceae bacterium]
MSNKSEGLPSEPGRSGSEVIRSRRGAKELPKAMTMAAVARSVGVSQGAISSLLNDRDYGIRVSQKTRDRVVKACREMGYIPNDLRAIVRIYPELGDTCVLVPNTIPGGLANPFLARVTEAVIANTTRKPATISVILYEEARVYGVEELPTPIKHGIVSKIICMGRANASICEVVHDRRLPAILLGHSSPIPGTTSVVADFPEAASLSLRLLVRHGHSHIGIVGDPFGSPEPRMSEIDNAIGHVAHELGLQIDAQDVFHGDLSFDAGVAALESLLARDSAPTAVICLSEASATGVMARAQARGISIPGQLSVLAFVDHPGTPATSVPLTTVVIPAGELGAAAVKEAERQVREGIPETAARVVVGVELIERSSCGPAAK